MSEGATAGGWNDFAVGRWLILGGSETCRRSPPHTEQRNDGSWGGGWDNKGGRLQTLCEGTQVVRPSRRDGAVGQGAKAESESDRPACLTDAVVAGSACVVFC